MDVAQIIDDRIGEVRFEALDLSFGEIASLHEQREIVIDPDYQRLFRWSEDQKSRLIESVLLRLPLPQIFLIENSDGVLELIDGLQRVSSVIQFIDSNLINLPPLELGGCDIIEQLNGLKFNDLSLSVRLALKRTPIRSVIIKKQSKGFLKYEMFKRLNTGGSMLSSQEIRNCSLRMLEGGAQFYAGLQSFAQYPSFQTATATLSETDKDQKIDEELVVRYLALKNGRELFKGSVRDWLDQYLESILVDGRVFDWDSERELFKSVFDLIADVLGQGAFVKYRDGRPIGALAPAYYEAVTMGLLENLEAAYAIDPEELQGKIAEVLESEEFRSQTGPGANTRPKLARRIELVGQAVSG
ncbi:MAG: DUF262 domain-containing protein [Erythrobacter sp.]|nr:DUF262 domain-containing protein [Erythrobacter sp.]NCQ62771.1 DUF262 domain-containing protein [Alphaproteobacteria bacterium]